MEAVIVEARGFSQSLPHYFETDDAYRAFQTHLLKDPAAGKVLPGCGGLRKIRWPDPRRGKGKRGGLRVIYLHVPEAGFIALIDVYDKDETDNLSVAQQHILSEIAVAVRKQILTRRKTGGQER